MKMSSLVVSVMLCFTTIAISKQRESVPPPYKGVACVTKMGEFDEMLFLMQKRLGIMHEVARWKWNHKVDANDYELELAGLEEQRAKVLKAEIPETWFDNFIESQKVASAMIEAEDVYYWEQSGVQQFPECDTQEDLQNYLVSLTDRIFDLVIDLYHPWAGEERCCLTVQRPFSKRPGDSFNYQAWDVAVSPFVHVD